MFPLGNYSKGTHPSAGNAVVHAWLMRTGNGLTYPDLIEVGSGPRPCGYSIAIFGGLRGILILDLDRTLNCVSGGL